MELIQQAYTAMMTGVIVVLAVLIVISIIRSILGPGVSDRIVAVNMIGTMVIMITAIFSVVLFCKVYTGVYLQRKHMLADLKAIEDNLNKQAESHEHVSEEEVRQ